MAHLCPNCGKPMESNSCFGTMSRGYYCIACMSKRIKDSEMAALRKYAKKYGYRLVKKSNAGEGGEVMDEQDKRIAELEAEVVKLLSDVVREGGCPTTEPTHNPYLTIWDSSCKSGIAEAMDGLVELGAAEYVYGKQKEWVGRNRSIRFVKQEEGGE